MQQGFTNWAVSNSSTSVKQQSSYLHPDFSVTANGYIGIFIDLTPYSKLSFIGKQNESSSSTYLGFGIHKSFVAPGSCTIKKTLSISDTHGEIDISGLEGNYYIILGGYKTTNTLYASMLNFLILS